MAKYSDIIEGLIILKSVDGDRHILAAEHDVLMAGPDTFDKLSDEGKARLDRLGWFWNEARQYWAIFI